MNYLAGIFISLLLAGNVFAASLCDSTCQITITFPGGGSIQAVKPMTITFGFGGYINDGAVTTGYFAGDTLSLGTLESIDFQENGSFDLGVGGNIDSTDLRITSDGVMSLAAVKGKKKIEIRDLHVFGAASINLSSGFEVMDSGSFDIIGGREASSTRLEFANDNSVNAYIQLNNADATLETDIGNNISGLVLIASGSNLKMTSKEVVLEANSAGVGGSDVSVVSSGAGLFSYISLLTVFTLLAMVRLQNNSNVTSV